MKLLRILASALCALSLLLQSGCWSNTDISELSFVMGASIDSSEEDGEYSVTVQLARPGAFGTSPGGGTDDEAYANITETGTDFEAIVNKLSGQINRALYFGHNQIIVIGMDTAKNGITPILDYYSRSINGRLTVSLYIADGRADDLLDIKGDIELLPVTYLKQLMESRLTLGEVSENAVIGFLADMMSETTAPLVSILRVVDDGSGAPRAESCGMAVFKGDAVCTTLDKQQTEAVFTVRNKAKGNAIQIDTLGCKMSLKVMSSEANIEPVFNGSTLDKIRVDVDISCSISHISNDIDILSAEVRESVVEAVAAQVTDNLESTLKHTQEYSADVFRFGDMLYRYHPKETAELIENWEEEYPKLKVEFNVSADILSTGSIIPPLTPGSDKDN